MECLQGFFPNANLPGNTGLSSPPPKINLPPPKKSQVFPPKSGYHVAGGFAWTALANKRYRYLPPKNDLHGKNPGLKLIQALFNECTTSKEILLGAVSIHECRPENTVDCLEL